MNPKTVQTLVLRAPHGPAVAHQILRIPDGAGRAAACLLARLQPSFGLPDARNFCCSIGFSYAGLEALGVPKSYLRVFRRLAPAFTDGAVRRSVRVGDGGESAAKNWRPEFCQDHAHVLLSWHGKAEAVSERQKQFAELWKEHLRDTLREPLASERQCGVAPERSVQWGARIGAPHNEQGQWMHFGFRDGISEVCIDVAEPRPEALDCRRHAPGALLLGHVNDAGFNPFALSRAPDKVRAFFRDSSFGILRPMRQDLTAFEDQLDQWQSELAPLGDPAPSRDFLKAKLCGRWPNGRQPLPGDTVPKGSLVLDLEQDTEGTGCPFGSHVRRMRAAPDGHDNVYKRPLQRRSFPFGPAAWSTRPTDGIPRGQIGHFFCASIEDQFEHLLGQWAARPPLGLPADDSALDPLMGPHDDAGAALRVPIQGRPDPLRLKGFRAWTTTLGTMYAWHPGQGGLTALLADDFVADEDDRPWL
jgi:deferrochelatase/peroxidase EfeB